MTAKEFLRSIRKMTLEIDALGEEITQLRHEAEGIRAMTLSDMPKGGQPKDAAEIIAEVCDLQRTRYALVLERLAKREEAMVVITQIADGEERTVLMMRYILGKSWDEIVDETHYAYSSVFKLHGEALRSFERVSKSVE